MSTDLAPVSLVEFARRLCAAAHPLYSTTGMSAPCGQHQAEARNWFALTQSDGTASLRIILEARRQNGLSGLL